MTYEATKVELFGFNNDGQQVNYLYSGTSFALKGTLVQISGATDGTRICTPARTIKAPIAGILSQDVSGTDIGGANSLNVGVWTQGVFQFRTSGTTVAGQPMMSASQTGSINWIRGAPALVSASGPAVIIGYAQNKGVAQGNEGFLTEVRLNL